MSKRISVMDTRRVALAVVVMIAMNALSAVGAQYYVAGSSAAANDANPGTEAAPWKTIAKANATLMPGDTVFIKAGMYSNTLEPSRSGTASQPITFSNYGSDYVAISNIAMGVRLINKNYIKIKGLNVVSIDTFLNMEGSSHNEFANCTFGPMRNMQLWQACRLYFNSQYNWIHHCTFGKYGDNSAGSDDGSVMAVGEEGNTSDSSDYNLIENNTFYHGGHDVVSLFARFTVLRNNYFHNENWQSGHGNRCVGLGGFEVNAGWNLIDGNRIGYSGIPADADGAPGLTVTTRRNIVRRNYFYHCNENGILLSTTANYDDSPSFNRIYNNTVFHNGFNPLSPDEARCGIGFAKWGGTRAIATNAVKNNLFWGNTVSFDSYGINMAEQIFAGNWEQTSNPLFVNASTTLDDPFNPSLPNLQLQAQSPCIDAGAFLAKILSPSGSGTSIQVDEAGYFMNGWGIIEGDLIQLQNSSQRARIVSVNYTANIITVDSTLTWTQNQGVALAYNGRAPDVGAYEYQPPNAPPQITSSSSARGKQGQPFTYQIAADNAPTIFQATGLPAGLTVATNTGIISGVPQVNGTFNATISAANSFGSGSAPLTITIDPPSPIIAVNPGQLAFPDTGTGQYSELQISVTNSGVGTLTGTASAAAPFSVVSGASYSLANGQVWTVVVRYSPTAAGANNGTVTLTGGGGATVNVSGTAFPVLGWNFAATAGMISPPFTASAGSVSQSVTTTGNPVTSGSGRALYGFVITNAGDYIVNASINAPDTGADSLYINIDAEPTDPTMIWDVPLTAGFEQRTAAWRGNGAPGVAEFSPKVFALTPGVHKLIVRGREPGLQFQNFTIAISSTGTRPATPQGFSFAPEASQ